MEDKNLLNTDGSNDKITEKQLSFSYWFFTHMALLKKILIIVLASVGGVLWLYSLYFWIDYGFITGPKERAYLKEWINIDIDKSVRATLSANPIVVSEPVIFVAGVGQYDLIAQIKNPNDKWYVTFDYQFAGEGLNGDVRYGFLLPNDEKYIVSLGVERAFRPSNLRVEIFNIKYMKIDAHKISDYAKWKQDRLDIKILEQKFNPQATINQKNISTLEFSAVNDSAYSYWSVGFYALLYRRDELIAVNYTTAEQLLAGEKQDLQIQFYEGLPAISKVIIVPEIDILDSNSYISQI